MTIPIIKLDLIPISIVLQWTDELGASWKDENVLLIGFDDIQSVNEWGKHRQRSHGPAANFWFCLREQETKENGKIGGKPAKIALDKDLFWSVAFFFHEIGTCGIEHWDQDLQVSQRWSCVWWKWSYSAFHFVHLGKDRLINFGAIV